ncbi:magnesium transporter NIPA1 isoform X1 [Phycodurus eques]|uniref:magnesium transporter NIPA1 isoform X1 n=1 Tax=Phycodurus eques TaxID=693459 RepID=UPI002ACF0716|nr:magnesium transporter NIPA1 isoform X1 [Phycodurus eques]
MFSDWEPNVASKPAVGIAIAVISSFINGSTFVLQKKGILRSRQRGDSYLKDVVWWSGTLSMVVGQIGNFLAYNAAPAVIVTPLGALGVLFGAVLASRILEERLNTAGKLGCVLCCCGSAVLVLHAPASESVTSARQLEAGLADPVFVTYALLVLLTLAALMGRTAPAYGRPNVGTYAAICSLLGSFTVPCSKGLGVAARDVLSGGPAVALFLGLLATLGAGVLLQLFYINKALEAFDSSVFEAVYYAAFTSAALVSSALLFREWTALTAADWLAALCGLVTLCVGVALLRLSQEASLAWKQTKKTQ